VRTLPLARVLAAGLLALAAALPPARAAVDDTLTPAQQAWLQAHGSVRVAPERDYGPFIFEGAAGPEGLSVDMLALVQRHTGLRVDWLAPAPLGEQLRLAQQGRVDLLTSLRRTPERAAYLAFSAPYVRVPAIVVTRAGQARPLGALAGQAVAVGAGYAVERPMREAHPAVRWQPVPDDEAALLGVADGRFAAAVVDAASAAFVIRRRALRGLAGAGEVGFAYELSFAVRPDRPELLAIVDAGLRAIGTAERTAVLDRWLTPLDESALVVRAPWATRAAWVLLVLALVAAALPLLRRWRQGRPR
jgi:ABC-type amino acid transport substrate-binding protein